MPVATVLPILYSGLIRRLSARKRLTEADFKVQVRSKKVPRDTGRVLEQSIAAGKEVGGVNRQGLPWWADHT